MYICYTTHITDDEIFRSSILVSESVQQNRVSLPRTRLFVTTPVWHEDTKRKATADSNSALSRKGM